MRVIAGSAGGMNLFVPKTGLRPTMDRVKAAIFSMLGERVNGARVLDLFAGTGALGIEALSRGAASATFVELHPGAVACIRRNLEKTRLEGAVESCDAFRFLDRADGRGERYDLVFADPPYAKAAGERDFGTDLVRSAPLRRVLAEGGLLVLEQLPGTGPREGTHLRCEKLRRYGATEVAILGLPAEETAA